MMKVTLSYEKFKQTVKEELASYLPEEYQDLRMEFKSKIKNNGVAYDGIMLIREQKGKTKIAPCIYLETYFEMYQMDNDLGATLQDLANMVVETMEKMEEKRFLINEVEHIRDSLQERIYFRLVNTGKNKELLKTVPHREFLDLSIVYNLLFDNGNADGETADSVAIVTNDMLHYLQVDEEQLFTMAQKNTEKLFP